MAAASVGKADVGEDCLTEEFVIALPDVELEVVNNVFGLCFKLNALVGLIETLVYQVVLNLVNLIDLLIKLIFNGIILLLVFLIPTNLVIQLGETAKDGNHGLLLVIEL